VSVAGLILRYTEYAEGHFRKGGKPTSEVHGIRAALKRLNALYGGTPAAGFGPPQLRAVLAAMVKEGLALKTVNDYRGRIVRLFSWAVGRALVPPEVAAALLHVETQVPGRSEAPVYDPVPPAPDEHVERVLPHLHPDPARNAVLAAAVRVARITGMRPGEVCGLSAAEVDRTREPWLYTPASKTMHFGKPRKVWVGPKGRELLGPLLDAAGDGPVFAFPRRRGEGTVRLTVKFWQESLAAACERAKVPAFTPNQLRHAKATEVYERYEDDAAVAEAIGNTPEVSRQVYIDSPGDAVAKRIAEELG
jgi:integrase